MLRFASLLMIAGLVMLSPAFAADTSPSMHMALPASRSSELQVNMRKLWSDHVVWTRDYIVAAVAGAPDADEAAKRLLRNQTDIGDAIAPYYGPEAGKQLTELLKQHILIAVDVVAAAKSGDQAKLQDADKRWHANAADLAVFLSKANPSWTKADMQDMLYHHLTLTTEEAVARLQLRWGDDVKAFDQIFVQALDMADQLSSGIIKQFPDKFSGQSQHAGKY